MRIALMWMKIGKMLRLELSPHSIRQSLNLERLFPLPLDRRPLPSRSHRRQHLSRLPDCLRCLSNRACHNNRLQIPLPPRQCRPRAPKANSPTISSAAMDRPKLRHPRKRLTIHLASKPLKQASMITLVSKVNNSLLRVRLEDFHLLLKHLDHSILHLSNSALRRTSNTTAVTLNKAHLANRKPA